MRPVRIDLYSDTKTRPSAAMRRAIAEAEVGDEQASEDPTVARLLERCCALLGQEAAMFLPSGTMANEIAIAVQCRPGEEVITHATGHTIGHEGGGPAAIAGVMMRPVPGPRGQFDAEALKAAIRPAGNRYAPRSRLLILEQTANIAGGTVWPAERMASVVALARERGLSAHLDGARLMNAAVAAGVPAAKFASQFDTVMLDFTKGLGAPLGAILAGRKAAIDEAWVWKQRLGGSMRQAGMMAAGCLYALDHNVERLAEDHDNARRLAAGLAQVRGIVVEPVESNMVYIDTTGTGLTAAGLNERMMAKGCRGSVMDDKRMRLVTHLDVPRALIDEAIGIIGTAARGA